MPTLPDLNQLSHAQKDELIRMQWPLQQQVQNLMAQMLVMQDRIKQLEGQVALNSRNSSKPPSSDGLGKPAPKSLRPAGKKPNGGQQGHSGNTLRQSAHVDATIVHQAATHCSVCYLELHEHAIVETRQVFELPRLAMRTVAHLQMRSSCTCGAVHLGAWPAGVNAPAQYGASVKAMAVHLNQYHLVPLARTAALMQDLYGAPVSQASIQSFAQESKATNLLKRLRDYSQDVWRFMSDEGVPFTNNLAEQALRMSKVKQKISGCFRTAHGADTFFTIRSYLATMHKQKGNLFACLVSVFNRQTIQPCLAG